MTHLRTAGAGLLAALMLPGLATAAGLNDTGITKCADGSSNDVSCNDPDRDPNLSPPGRRNRP